MNKLLKYLSKLLSHKTHLPPFNPQNYLPKPISHSQNTASILDIYLVLSPTQISQHKSHGCSYGNKFPFVAFRFCLFLSSIFVFVTFLRGLCSQIILIVLIYLIMHDNDNFCLFVCQLPTEKDFFLLFSCDSLRFYCCSLFDSRSFHQKAFVLCIRSQWFTSRTKQM
jgi:hypothetical protein